MSTMGLPGSPDRGGVWPVPFKNSERTLLIMQAKFDRRNIPQIWYWRLKLEDEVSGSSPNEIFAESPRQHRRYHAPIPVHLYLDWRAEQKAKKKGTTQTTGTVAIGISRAEARRLGVKLQTVDDLERLHASQKEEAIFLPRPLDIFSQRQRFYEVLQLTPEWLGATDIISRWVGTAAMLSDDIAEPGLRSLPPAPSDRPPGPEGLPWQG